MTQKPILYGAIGILVGFVGGIAIGSATSQSRVGEAVSQALAPAQAANESAAASQQEALTGLGERIAALEAAISEEGDGNDLTARLDALETGMQERLDALSEQAEAQSQAVRGVLADLSGGMEEAAQIAAAAVATRSGGVGNDGGGPAAAGMMVTDPLGVGETALFDDGRVRAFVSRLDPQGGSVRLAVNGGLVALGAGGSAPVAGGDCSVAVMALRDGRVTLGSDCGGAGERAEAAPAEAGKVPEEGYRPGHMARLADGALRVYVSGLGADGSAARLAVNGIETEMVATGSSLEVEVDGKACSVTVTGVGGGLVGLEGACG
ncbi:hypothetical protein [Salipiger abyssi]|uniref:hypothetical protein n=1 Tax=Salipiger abyssi TaxID=1250539 RepID=UPI001A8DBBD5|nr:hypothetical protein [Salipiger abyssi]MBN9887346.1 hypothetical protein [Salipiger abyssi]